MWTKTRSWQLIDCKPLNLNEVQIKQVKEFKHLGSLVEEEKKVMNVEQNKLIHQDLNKSILNTNTARTAVWIGDMDATQVNKLEVFQMFTTNGSFPPCFEKRPSKIMM